MGNQGRGVISQGVVVESMEEDVGAQSEGSFVELYLRHQRSLYAFIVQLVHDYNESEDLLQKTGVVLWRKFSEFEPGGDFPKWARGIAKYEVMAHLRSKRRSRVCFSTETIELLAADAQQESSHADARHAALLKCLERLKPDDRELARQCYAPQASIRQIAADLGRSVAGVYQSLHRIRHALLECIERRLSAEEQP